jgi:hypothetical protein
MVRDAHDAVEETSERPPRLLRQPADAPPPLGPVGANVAVASFRRVVADRQASTGRSLRSWGARISGRADRRLLNAVIEATDAVVTQCDLLTDRINARDAISADVANSLGGEVARLRAEVLHLQRLVASERPSG